MKAVNSSSRKSVSVDHTNQPTCFIIIIVVIIDINYFYCFEVVLRPLITSYLVQLLSSFTIIVLISNTSYFTLKIPWFATYVYRMNFHIFHITHQNTDKFRFKYSNTYMHTHQNTRNCFHHRHIVATHKAEQFS